MNCLTWSLRWTLLCGGTQMRGLHYSTNALGANAVTTATILAACVLTTA